MLQNGNAADVVQQPMQNELLSKYFHGVSLLFHPKFVLTCEPGEPGKYRMADRLCLHRLNTAALEQLGDPTSKP